MHVLLPDRMTMWSNFILIIFISKVVADQDSTSLDEYLDKKIAVLLSDQKPFATLSESGASSGLDVLILNSFAKKNNLQANYVHLNESLNYVLAHQEYSKVNSVDGKRFLIAFCMNNKFEI